MCVSAWGNKKACKSDECMRVASLFRACSVMALNQKSGSNIFLVSTHSACPYKNYSLKLFAEPNHYII